MLTYELTSRDLEDVRFAISPAAEAVLSLRALRDPGRFPLQLPWVRAVQPLIDALDWSVLGLLVNATMGSPDFLTPRPTSPLTQFQDELAIIATVDRTTFERQLVAVNGRLPTELAGPDGVTKVVDALNNYWQTAMAPYWPRMRTVLSADISFRGHVLTEQGTGAMLNELGPAISYADGLLRVDRVSVPAGPSGSTAADWSCSRRCSGRTRSFRSTSAPNLCSAIHLAVRDISGRSPSHLERDVAQLIGTACARILDLSRIPGPRATSPQS